MKTSRKLQKKLRTIKSCGTQRDVSQVRSVRPSEQMVLPDQTPRLDPPRLPYYGVPFPQNTKFFGRNAELEQIRATFARRSESIAQPILSGAGRSKSTSSIKEAGPSPRSLSICGLGGIGKTQLALEYASLYRGQYDAILWVYCQHRASIADSFIQIAADLFPASPSRDSLLCQNLVLQWLQSTGGFCYT